MSVKVLLNSDITYSQGRSVLTKRLTTLAEACRERHFEIALPTTTVLEFERQALESARNERKALADAAALLDRFDIAHAEFKPNDLVRTRSLDELLRETGVSVEVISPTLADFNDAHRRACLHLSPQAASNPGEKEDAEDEMRDLVIWSIAIRLAREQGGALLVSRDKVHTGRAGRDEAESVGLSILPTIEDALRFFSIETPDAKLFIEMVTPVWSQLPALGLAVSPEVSVLDVRNARFVRGPSGPSFGVALVRVRLASGEEKSLVIQLRAEPGAGTTVDLFSTAEEPAGSWTPVSSADRTGNQTDDQSKADDPQHDLAYDQKLERLRTLIGGQDG